MEKLSVLENSKLIINRNKFKGQRVDNGEWVFGDLINTPENHTRIIYWIDNSCDGIFNYKDYNFEVIPESVAQFTGLYDKNEEEIYEKDKVKYYYDWDYIDGKREFMKSTPKKQKFYEGIVEWEGGSLAHYVVNPNRMCLRTDSMLIELIK